MPKRKRTAGWYGILGTGQVFDNWEDTSAASLGRSGEDLEDVLDRFGAILGNFRALKSA